MKETNFRDFFSKREEIMAIWGSDHINWRSFKRKNSFFRALLMAKLMKPNLLYQSISGIHPLSKFLPVGICLIRVKYGNTRTMCEIRLKLIMKIPERTGFRVWTCFFLTLFFCFMTSGLLYLILDTWYKIILLEFFFPKCQFV